MAAGEASGWMHKVVLWALCRVMAIPAKSLPGSPSRLGGAPGRTTDVPRRAANRSSSSSK